MKYFLPPSQKEKLQGRIVRYVIVKKLVVTRLISEQNFYRTELQDEIFSTPESDAKVRRKNCTVFNGEKLVVCEVYK